MKSIAREEEKYGMGYLLFSVNTGMGETDITRMWKCQGKGTNRKGLKMGR